MKSRPPKSTSPNNTWTRPPTRPDAKDEDNDDPVQPSRKPGKMYGAYGQAPPQQQYGYHQQQQQQYAAPANNQQQQQQGQQYQYPPHPQGQQQVATTTQHGAAASSFAAPSPSYPEAVVESEPDGVIRQPPPTIYVDTQHDDMVHDAQLDYYGTKLATGSSGESGDLPRHIFRILSRGEADPPGRCIRGSHTSIMLYATSPRLFIPPSDL